MSDIDVVPEQLGRYPGTLTEAAQRLRQLASGATGITTATGRADSSAAAAGLAEHLGALVGDLAGALDHDAEQVSATHETLLRVDQQNSAHLRRLM